jgi:hypothetical protein
MKMKGYHQQIKLVCCTYFSVSVQATKLNLFSRRVSNSSRRLLAPSPFSCVDLNAFEYIILWLDYQLLFIALHSTMLFFRCLRAITPASSNLPYPLCRNLLHFKQALSTQTSQSDVRLVLPHNDVHRRRFVVSLSCAESISP